MFGAKEGSVTLPNGTIDYVTFGKGSRDLVLVPGLVLGLKRLRGTGAQGAWLRLGERYEAADALL